MCSLVLYLGNAGLEAFQKVLLCHAFAKDDEYGVVSCQGAQDFGQIEHIHGKADGVGMARASLDDAEVAAEFD